MPGHEQHGSLEVHEKMACEVDTGNLKFKSIVPRLCGDEEFYRRNGPTSQWGYIPS